MIIVEGTDLLGKTTLCEELVKKLNALGYPHVYQHLSKLPLCFHPVADYKPLIQENIVWDRFHMSRQAYGEALKNQWVNTPHQYELIEAWCRLVGTYTVIVVADNDDLIRQQWAKKNRDEMYDRDSIIKVNEIFKQFIDDRFYDWDLVIRVPGDGDKGLWPSEHADSIVNSYVVKREQAKKDLSGVMHYESS